jgi:hypothetical protein
VSIRSTVEAAYAELDRIADKLEADRAPEGWLEIYVVDEERLPVLQAKCTGAPCHDGKGRVRASSLLSLPDLANIGSFHAPRLLASGPLNSAMASSRSSAARINAPLALVLGLRVDLLALILSQPAESRRLVAVLDQQGRGTRGPSSPV